MPPTPQPRDTSTDQPPHMSNLIGLWTLYTREVRRFTKVYLQTIMAPVVTTMLFMAVFTLAIGRYRPDIAGVPFTTFLAPGLIMMAMVQNSFANTSSSLMSAKVQGNIVDTLMPPLTADELTAGYALGGMTRGLVVGVSVAIAMMLVVGLSVHNPLLIIFHAVAAALLLSQFGIVGAMWADKFDHISAVTHFIVTPLAFLSGTFYSIEALPEGVRTLAMANPFFYMIDGFRYGFIGHADGSIPLGIAILSATNVAMWLLVRGLFKSGWKLKA